MPAVRLISHPILFILIITSFSSLSFADIPNVISYQGKVTDSGGDPVADGNYTMRFRIYDASTGGSVEWDSGNRTITVSDGVFNILLGESPQPSLDLEFDEDYWLLVTFAGVNQSPRQRLASTGYTYMASGLTPGTVITGNIPSDDVLEVVNQGEDGIGIRARVITSPNPMLAGTAVYATTSGPGPAIEGRAETGASSGIGIYGFSSSMVAVMGITTDTQSAGMGADIGVWGEATTTGPSGSYGVYGKGQIHGGLFEGQYIGIQGSAWTTESGGIGVYGYPNGTTETSYGVKGKTVSTSNNSVGVYGEAEGSVGTIYGIYGISNSTGGRGVYGEATTTTGVTIGGSFKSNSITGTGVYGEASASTGSTCGVYGWNSSSQGKGVYGRVVRSSGTTYGVYGESVSTGGRGVCGFATATTGSAYGVYGNSASTQGAGIFGWATASSGTTYGVYGRSFSPSGYGVYYVGGLGGTGLIQSIVLTSRGPTGLDVVTSAGNWVEDFGEGRLVNGTAHVELDPLYLETVTINKKYPMKVFLQPQDMDCKGLAAIPGFTGFDVGELLGGESNSSFTYRVIAKRKGFEDKRLDYCEAAENDPYLYQKLKEEELEELKVERFRMEEENARMDTEQARMEKENALMKEIHARLKEEQARMDEIRKANVLD